MNRGVPMASVGSSRRDFLGGMSALLTAGLLPRASAEGLADPRARPGLQVVTELEGVWRDSSRGERPVPWRAFVPEALREPAPVVLHSHGGGGTRSSGAMFGRHLASHGFIALHLQHLGSDRDAFRNDPRQISAAARDPRLGADRFEDVGFAWRQLQDTRTQAALAGRVDPQRIGISGHSFGAITALIAAGQSVSGYDRSLSVPQLKAAFALSPSAPRARYGDAATAFRDMLMPIFHLTGTEDHAPNGDFTAPARRIPFDRITDVDQWLLVLSGANHFTFAGEPNPRLGGRSFRYPGLDRHHEIIKVASIAFWSWIMHEDADALAFLDGGGYRRLLGPDDSFQIKKAA